MLDDGGAKNLGEKVFVRLFFLPESLGLVFDFLLDAQERFGCVGYVLQQRVHVF